MTEYIHNFNEDEMDRCVKWSEDMEKKKGKWDCTRRYSNDGKFLTHFQSKKAEVAAANITGLEVNWDIHIRGDDGVDLKWKDYTIDVKYVSANWYGFKTNTESLDDFAADIGILVAPVSKEFKDCPHYITGVITRTKFRRRAENKDFGYGGRWVVEKENLQDPLLLLKFLRDKGAPVPDSDCKEESIVDDFDF